MTTQTDTQPMTTIEAEQMITDFVNSTETSQLMRSYRTRFLLGAGVADLVKFVYRKAQEGREDDKRIADSTRSLWNEGPDRP